MKNRKHKDVELGCTAKDKVTGFTGIVVARYQEFCPEYGVGEYGYYLQSTQLRDGKPGEKQYFSDSRVEYVDRGLMLSDSAMRKLKGAA